MAKIPLRAYNREIEGMIDRGQASLAIAHSRHILKYYPKHIDTYRLLGKAFLETQRYAEAADVLQRVLSTVPDDFISQIGMSIIREDEGNLDAAIWHMEKAFEAQPSNTAVQDELRRLYGRRDGVEPPKIRLTRGALVRMYARGELYQQAIAEIRAALAEDPLRVDLEVILARMYYLSGQTVAAIEVCSRLVNKLPYCFEANRILAEVLPTTSRADDAKLYQQRVYAMDPYLAYLPPNAISSAEVADNAVTLDQLEIEAGEETSQLPEWAQTVGVDWKEEQAGEETLPDWFSALKPDAEGNEAPPDFSAAATLGFQEVQSAESASSQVVPDVDLPLIEAEPEGEIPEWMKEAGWAPAESTDEAVQAGFNIPEEELEIADIPEWLQEIAPEDSETMAAAESEAEAEGVNWLESILPQEEAALEADEGETPVQDVLLVDENLSELEEQPPDEETVQPIIDLSTESHIFTPQSEQPSEIEETAPFLEEERPDWLKELSNSPLPDEPADTSITELAPNWIEETQAKTPIEIVKGEEVPSEPTEAPQDMLDVNDMDATMAWLEGLASRQGADEETLLTPPEERPETPPEWVQALGDQVSEPGMFNTTDETAPTIEAIEEIVPTDMEIQPDETSLIEDELAALGVVLTLSAKTDEIESAPTEELPDWLVESLEEEEQSLSPDTAETEWSDAVTPQSAPLEAHGVDSDKSVSTQPLDEDATFAWLESLAARQGAEEDTLLVPPEQREQAIPDWLQEESLSKTEPPAAFEESVHEVPIPQILPERNDTSVEPTVELEETVEDTQPVVLRTSEPLPSGVTEEKTTQPSNTSDTYVSEAEQESVPDWLQTLEKENETITSPAPSEWVPEFEPPIEEIPAAIIAESEPSLEGASSDDLLKAAQAALEAHNVERALQSYNHLISKGDYLEETIHDLRDALYRYPIDTAIWQTLGDAYMRSNRLQEALEAYTKAEELLR